METLRHHLHHALTDVFKRPIDVQIGAESLKFLTGHSKLHLVTIGPYNVGKSFKEALAPTQVDKVGTGMIAELQAISPKIKPDGDRCCWHGWQIPGRRFPR